MLSSLLLLFFLHLLKSATSLLQGNCIYHFCLQCSSLTLCMACSFSALGSWLKTGHTSCQPSSKEAQMLELQEPSHRLVSAKVSAQGTSIGNVHLSQSLSLSSSPPFSLPSLAHLSYFFPLSPKVQSLQSQVSKPWQKAQP